MRHAAFQAAAVMTTTGLATLDWTRFAPAGTLTLLGLMFVGARAGSPSGSIKVVRHLTLFRFARRELEQAVDDVSTAILTLLTFLGRIEIVPLAVLVGRSYWRP
jgi:Trk-type K+ transport system membrane component